MNSLTKVGLIAAAAASLFAVVRYSEVFTHGVKKSAAGMRSGSLYSFKAMDANKNVVDLGDLARNKVVLLVNVASE